MSDWLLMLGSNLQDPDMLDRALKRLSKCGTVACLCRCHLPSRSGDGPWFHNALVTLNAPGELDREGLQRRLRQIEDSLGRDRDDPRQVRIDIDILARFEGDWVADPHALRKGEFSGLPALPMLHQAGLRILGCKPEGS